MKEVKTNKRWRPKHRWIESITINLKGGKTKYKYFTPKTPEEEKEWEKAFAERWTESMKILWGDKFDWFVRNVKYFIDKYGEKEFIRRWSSSMRELEREEKTNPHKKEMVSSKVGYTME